MNVGPVGQFLQFFDELLKLLAVEFVVAKHVDDGSLRKGLQRPLQAVAARTDIASQNHGLNLNVRRRKGLKFQMQIAKDVKAHGVLGSRPPLRWAERATG